MYKFLLRRKIKQLIKCSEREKAYRNLKEIESVLVLFDTEDYNDADAFIQQMQDTGKKINVIAFKSSKGDNNLLHIPYSVVTEKDMKSESFARIIKNLAEKKFDLAVDFTLKENLLLLYTLVSVNAPLKVGFYKYTLPVHDLVLSFAPGSTTNMNELGKQLIHYLTVISSDKRNGS